jgi:hypothetical protein
VSKDKDVVLKLSNEEARYLCAVLHIAGFQEKREISEDSWGSQTTIATSVGRILKRLRKAMA